MPCVSNSSRNRRAPRSGHPSWSQTEDSPRVDSRCSGRYRPRPDLAPRPRPFRRPRRNRARWACRGAGTGARNGESVSTSSLSIRDEASGIAKVVCGLERHVACERNVRAELQGSLSARRVVARPTMKDELLGWTDGLELLDCRRGRLTSVDDQRLVMSLGELDVIPKGRPLNVVWRVVAVEVEARSPRRPRPRRERAARRCAARPPRSTRSHRSGERPPRSTRLRARARCASARSLEATSIPMATICSTPSPSLASTDRRATPLFTEMQVAVRVEPHVRARALALVVFETRKQGVALRRLRAGRESTPLAVHRERGSISSPSIPNLRHNS